VAESLFLKDFFR